MRRDYVRKYYWLDLQRLCAVHELKDLKDSALWNEYIERYHYLGYKPLAGVQLRYFAYAAERVVGLFGFSAAAWKTGPRDAYIGWSREQRHRNLEYVVNNSRLITLPKPRIVLGGRREMLAGDGATGPNREVYREIRIRSRHRHETSLASAATGAAFGHG